jgi:hypothetical protein
MKCCEKEVTTAFCPHCGKKFGGSVGHSLLSHLRKEADANKRKLDKAIEISGDRPDRPDWLERKRVVFDKWNSWAQWVEARISEESGMLEGKR